MNNNWISSEGWMGCLKGNLKHAKANREIDTMDASSNPVNLGQVTPLPIQ